MTEMIMDVLDEIGLIKYFALRWAFCVKHKEQYGSIWTTAGIIHCCESCMMEKFNV